MLRNQLTGATVTYSDEESLSQLLHALPYSYKGFVSLVGNQTNISFDRYVEHLRKEEV